MFRTSLKAFAALSVLVGGAAAQTFDTSANGQLNGAYFVREVLIAGQNANGGGITQAIGVTGTLTFDGKGNYSFNGQVAASNGGVSAKTLAGTYRLGSNGLFVMDGIADSTDICYGVVSAIGPSAIVASATEGNNTDLLIAIPAGAGLNTASLKGSYAGGLVDFTSANIAMVRNARFTLNADGAGNFGTVAATGAAVNLGGTQLTQNVTGATYTLGSTGSGSATFGASVPTQLLSGTKNLYMSVDGNILLGGNPAGFDMVVAIRSLTGTASNATAGSLYFTGGLEDLVDASGHLIDAFYGSANANGKGTTLAHQRLKYTTDGAFDFTFDNEYTVQTNGTILPTDIPFYNFTFGVAGKAFVATGTNGLYSLQVGFGAPVYTGTGVFINPAGIVNAANFAPITNPVAPNEVTTLFGSGLSSATVSATTLPLPTILNGVQVTVNGTPAPLFYVSAGQIAFLVPPSITPALKVSNATIQVTNNGTKSNSVTVYTSYTAPGVFSAAGSGIGGGAVTHVDGSLVTPAKPAQIDETIVAYVGGLGSTTPSVPSGAPSPSNPPAMVDDTSDTIDFGGTKASILFNGLTPGLSGLYQINATVASGTPIGTDYINLVTLDGYSSQTIASIAPKSTAKAVAPAHPESRRPRPLDLPQRENRAMRERAK